MHEGAEIARGLRSRDPELLDQLIEQYQHRLFRYLLYFTRDQQMAEDIFQETWIRVLEKGRQFNPQWKFETWLISIARNLAIDTARRRRTTTFTELEHEGEDEPVFDVADTRATAALEQVIQQQLDQRVADAVQHLSPLYREALLLRFQEDLSIEEIARVVGSPLSTVKSRLHRGMAMLADRLRALSILPREVQP